MFQVDKGELGVDAGLMDARKVRMGVVDRCYTTLAPDSSIKVRPLTSSGDDVTAVTTRVPGSGISYVGKPLCAVYRLQRKPSVVSQSEEHTASAIAIRWAWRIAQRDCVLGTDAVSMRQLDPVFRINGDLRPRYTAPSRFQTAWYSVAVRRWYSPEPESSSRDS